MTTSEFIAPIAGAELADPRKAEAVLEQLVRGPVS